MSTVIRRNAHRKIESILRSAVLIRECKIDDMGDTNATVAPERVLECGRQCEFDRVYLTDSGSLRVLIHANWWFTAYPSVEVARRELRPEAFAKYFPLIAGCPAEMEAMRLDGFASEVIVTAGARFEGKIVCTVFPPTADLRTSRLYEAMIGSVDAETLTPEQIAIAERNGLWLLDWPWD